MLPAADLDYELKAQGPHGVAGSGTSLFSGLEVGFPRRPQHIRDRHPGGAIVALTAQAERLRRSLDSAPARSARDDQGALAALPWRTLAREFDLFVPALFVVGIEEQVRGDQEVRGRAVAGDRHVVEHRQA
jgi:hypothetical protein